MQTVPIETQPASRPRPWYTALLLAVWIGLLAAEILCRKYPAAGKVGIVLWLASFVFLAAFTLRAFGTLLREIPRRGILTPIMVILWFVLVIVNIPRVKNVSCETTQETAQALNLLESAPDWGFQRSAFLGYPARQFVLPALPSLLFGRNVTALHAGGSLYFLLGLMIFATGVAATFDKPRTGDWAGAFLLALIFHIYYVNFLLFWFEQSIFPFSFGLMLVGLFLHYRKNPAPATLLLMGFPLLYLAHTYTPSLAILGLGGVGMLYLGIRMVHTIRERILVTLILAVVAVSVQYSVLVRTDVTKSSRIKITEGTPILEKSFNALAHVVLGTGYPPMVSPVFYGLFLFAIFTPLLLLYGWKMFVLSGWILATLWVSVMTRGYADPPIHYAVHRANVIFPVLLAMLLFIPAAFRIEVPRRLAFALAAWVFVLATGLYYQGRYLNDKGNEERMRHVEFIQWVQTNTKGNQTTGELYFAPELRTRFIALYDALQYFLPGWRTTVLDQQTPPLVPPHVNTPRILIVPHGNWTSTPANITQNAHPVPLGKFLFKQDAPLDVFTLTP